MIKRILIYILLTIFALFFLMPIYVLLATSLKPLREVGLERMWFPPNSFSFDGFSKAFARLAPNLRNSFLLVIPATFLSAIIGSINGYVLS
ncbi:MAG: carbohydrate ABC transporter permease, partial [Kosmotogaceae bacterium]